MGRTVLPFPSSLSFSPTRPYRFSCTLATSFYNQEFIHEDGQVQSARSAAPRAISEYP